jgi:signal transduction histidine kinase
VTTTPALSPAPTPSPPPESAPAPLTTYRYRTGRVSIGMLFLLLGAAFLLDAAGALHFTPAMFWPIVVIAVGAGMLLSRARRLQVEEDRSAQLAVAEERVRIARELHDIVAHGVSLMTIQIAAARRVGPSKPDAAKESLEAAERTGRQTLSELETMLAVLRGADASIGAASSSSGRNAGPGSAGRHPLPRLDDIASLVDSLRQAGRTVTFDVLGDAPAVAPSVEVVIYRVVQEALTNAVRYAGDAPIDVQLVYSPTAITVFVDDEGTGPTSAARQGSGHGLAGMSERLATVGGTLEAGPRRPGPGWRVHASVPILAMTA